jgi:hypothetical protein
VPVFTVTSIGALAQTSGATTGVVTLTAGASVGDLVVVGIASGSVSGVNTIIDSKGNTWTAGAINNTGTFSGRTQLFWSVLTAALLTGDTITENSGTSKQRTIDVLRCQVDTGWAGTSATVADQQVGSNGATNTLSTGASAPTVAPNELIVAMSGWSDTTSTLTAGTGYTASPAGSLHAGAKSGAAEYAAVSAAGAQTATATITAAAGWQMQLATFMAGTGIPAPVVFNTNTARMTRQRV